MCISLIDLIKYVAAVHLHKLTDVLHTFYEMPNTLLKAKK